MISTTAMILIGKVEGNKMIDMQLTNQKLSERAANIVMKKLNVGKEKANKLLKKYNSVRLAIKNGNS